MNPTVRMAEGAGERGLVSVVIPSYNRATLVQETIESVLAQTYKSVEIIVVDDGSTDGTRDVVERYGAPVRYVWQQNGGVATARNTGFMNARGEFIALLDSDDLYLPWKLELQVTLLRAYPEVGMVWSDMALINPEGVTVSPTYLRTFYGLDEGVLETALTHGGTLGDLWSDAPSEISSRPFYVGDLFPRMMLGNHVHTSTILLRRDRLRRVGGFDVSLTPVGEDYDFSLRTCFHGPVAFVDVPTLLYRMGHGEQLTAKTPAIARANLRTVREWMGRAPERRSPPPQLRRKRLADSYAWVGEEELLRGSPSAATEHLWQSIRIDPTQPRRFMLLGLSLIPAFLLRPAIRAGRSLRQYRASVGHG